MEIRFKNWLRTILFVSDGVIAGLAYYYLLGCKGGSCLLTSNPGITMGYMGLIGWLLSGIFSKGGRDKCNL